MSTVSGPIRFRCFQCNKLLGVSRSKAGAVVACPQCSAELVVPEAEDGAEPPSAPLPPEPAKPSSSSSRIEPVVVLWDAAPTPEGSSDSAPAFVPLQLEPVSLRAEPARSRSATRAPKAPNRDMADAVDVSAAMAAPNAAPARPAVEPVVLPTVAVELPSLREEPVVRGQSPRPAARERSGRRDDVVLPRTAMVLWSFLVLLALVFAFVAGLLAGRFLWARGGVVPANKPIAVHNAGESNVRIDEFLALAIPERS